MEEDISLLEEYESLPLIDKRKKLGKEIAEMTFVTEKMIADIMPGYEVKPIEEYDNLFDGTTSEDDYLVGLYDDLLDLQEALAVYYDFVTNFYYEKETNEDMN